MRLRSRRTSVLLVCAVVLIVAAIPVVGVLAMNGGATPSGRGGARAPSAAPAGAATGGGPAAPRGTPFTALGPGGLRIHAWATPARPGAPTLVVINGGPGLSHAAAPPAGVLAPQFRVVAYDQRGTGLSRAPENTAFDLPDQVGDLEALRRRLGVARIDLLGHSWGGLIAAAYAASFPRHVGALVLADGEPIDPAAASRGTGLLMRRIGTLTAHGVIPAQVPSPSGDDCTAGLNALAPAYVANPRLSVAPMPPHTCSETVSTLTANAQTPSLLRTVASALHHYRGPALVIFGGEDPFRPAFEPADVAELAAARLRVTVLPHAGHMAWLESPRFWPDIRRFLAGAQ
ncbi:MAG TPA: alpha/beta hydrolase [Solirubrobacteraceae bacterium]|nr:alpha/beta hydrolase [Solirubrobacteraceae bacterium]